MKKNEKDPSPFYAILDWQVNAKLHVTNQNTSVWSTWHHFKDLIHNQNQQSAGNSTHPIKVETH